MARQIARLGRSTPSMSAISGRSAEGELELESGTTTMRSAAVPALRRSLETTTAGLCFPGSPRLAAPSDTSHTSPRWGSVDAIAQCGLPQTRIFKRSWILSIGDGGLPLRLPYCLDLTLARHLRQQCGKRHTARSCLLCEPIARSTSYSYRRRFSSHVWLIIAPNHSATSCDGRLGRSLARDRYARAPRPLPWRDNAPHQDRRHDWPRLA